MKPKKCIPVLSEIEGSKPGAPNEKKKMLLVVGGTKDTEYAKFPDCSGNEKGVHGAELITVDPGSVEER